MPDWQDVKTPDHRGGAENMTNFRSKTFIRGTGSDSSLQKGQRVQKPGLMSPKSRRGNKRKAGKRVR